MWGNDEKNLQGNDRKNYNLKLQRQVNAEKGKLS